MRVLTQNRPWGRRGIGGWSLFRRLGAEGRAWMRRGLLAVLAIWLTVLSQGVLAAACTVTFATNMNVQKSYVFTASDTSNCDPFLIGIAYDSAGDANSSSGPVFLTATAQGGDTGAGPGLSPASCYPGRHGGGALLLRHRAATGRSNDRAGGGNDVRVAVPAADPSAR